MCNFEFSPLDPLNKIIILLYMQFVCVFILMPERQGDAGAWELICILILNSGRSRQTTRTLLSVHKCCGTQWRVFGSCGLSPGTQEWWALNKHSDQRTNSWVIGIQGRGSPWVQADQELTSQNVAGGSGWDILQTGCEVEPGLPAWWGICCV